MNPSLTPMRWPSTWTDPSVLQLLKGSAINCLLVEKGAQLDAVRGSAEKLGLKIFEPGSPPPGVVVAEGEFPGVKAPQSAADADAGPTGVPWVDSNGFRVRVTAALNPSASVWIDAAPPDKTRAGPGSYLLAFADSAAHGGRWIVSLHPEIAAGLAAGNQPALAAWQNLTAATTFFAQHQSWTACVPEATAGVISSFSGDDEFFSHEMLNLLARAGQHYRIILKDSASPASFRGLRGVTYSDAVPPAPALRAHILRFVENGGLLVTSPKWGPPPGLPAKTPDHPRYTSRTLGKGRVAIGEFDDPYMVANDTAVLISHRHDLVRFWNGGANASFYTVTPDRKQAIVHLLFYSYRGPDSASVRIAGPYRKARIMTVDRPSPVEVAAEPQASGIEIHLPQVSQYVAVQLD